MKIHLKVVKKKGEYCANKRSHTDTQKRTNPAGVVVLKRHLNIISFFYQRGEGVKGYWKETKKSRGVYRRKLTLTRKRIKNRCCLCGN